MTLEDTINERSKHNMRLNALITETAARLAKLMEEDYDHQVRDRKASDSAAIREVGTNLDETIDAIKTKANTEWMTLHIRNQKERKHVPRGASR